MGAVAPLQPPEIRLDSATCGGWLEASLSGDGSAAVEGDDLTGDVGTVGDEEVDQVGDVLGGAGAIERDALQILFALALRVVIGPFDYARAMPFTVTSGARARARPRVRDARAALLAE